MLVIPGGFSYADALGAGRLLALDMTCYFEDEVRRFVESGKPVIGICNGFQALVKAGILPGFPAESGKASATLTFNVRGHFECRWVHLLAASQICVWTRGLTQVISCPVAHGEGNFVLADSKSAYMLRENDQIALVYAGADGLPARGTYPSNPNGSAMDVAGICNLKGNVLGLMPHPENHIFPQQHPHWTRGESGGSGLSLFKNGILYASQL
jgi:phosphoribosylformylglycinamidine synthase